MQKLGGRARGDERRGYLLSDQAGLAHARNHHPAPTAQDGVDGLLEAFVDASNESGDCVCLDLENSFCLFFAHFVIWTEASVMPCSTSTRSTWSAWSPLCPLPRALCPLPPSRSCRSLSSDRGAPGARRFPACSDRRRGPCPGRRGPP